MAALMDPQPEIEESSAGQYFAAASILDDGNPDNFEQASAAYRRALEIDPYLVPALINLANIHYTRDEIAEAQALYERAIALEPDVFEAHFNLGNIFHDLGRYGEAQRCYRDALKLNPAYADAHFYLAVTLEKNGQSQDARTYWKAYTQLVVLALGAPRVGIESQRAGVRLHLAVRAEFLVAVLGGLHPPA